MKEFEKLARLRKIVSKSQLTKKDVLELSTKISKALAKKYEKILKKRRRPKPL